MLSGVGRGRRPRRPGAGAPLRGVGGGPGRRVRELVAAVLQLVLRGGTIQEFILLRHLSIVTAPSYLWHAFELRGRVGRKNNLSEILAASRGFIHIFCDKCSL